MSVGAVLCAAVALVAIGLAVAFVGILAPPLFLPGTWIILAGLVGCVAAGVLAILRTPASSDT